MAQLAEPPIVDGTQSEGVAHVTRRSWRSHCETIGWSLVAGGMFVVALVVTFLTFDLVDGNLASVVSGQVVWWQHVEFRGAVIVALFAGILVAHPYEEAASRRELPWLESGFLDTESDPLQDPLETADPSGLRRAGLLGVLVMTAIVPTLYTEPARFLRLETFALPSVLFDLAVGAVLGWITARMLYASVVQDRR